MIPAENDASDWRLFLKMLEDGSEASERHGFFMMNNSK